MSRQKLYFVSFTNTQCVIFKLYRFYTTIDKRRTKNKNFIQDLIFNHSICAYFKNRTGISAEFRANFKIGAHLWDQLFSVNFFDKKMGKIVPQLKKIVFFLNRQKHVLLC